MFTDTEDITISEGETMNICVAVIFEGSLESSFLQSMFWLKIKVRDSSTLNRLCIGYTTQKCGVCAHKQRVCGNRK